MVTIKSIIILPIVSAAMLILGCVMERQDAGEKLDSNTSIMNAWHTYEHCLSTPEPVAIVSDLLALNRFADSVSAKGDPRRLRLLSYSLPALPSRLAVDPAAMVKACAKHGTDVALSLEEPKGSVELLITAVTAQLHPTEPLK